MLNRTAPQSSESPTQWIRVFLAKDATDIKIEYVYRGDDRVPQQIFSEGFPSRGTNRNLLSHVNPPGDWLDDSGYVSTSTSKAAATRFPHNLRGRGFLYEVNLLPQAIDVIKALTPEVTKGALHPEDFETLHFEKERAFPLKIDKKDIKGAWPFDVLGEPGEFEKGRIVHKDYIPNPDYKVPVLTKVAGVTKIAGKAASAVGTVMDGALLYKTYKKSRTSGNYAPFFESATRIIGGWGGSITLGSQFGSVGAQMGAVMGPAGVFAGGVAGSLVGSVLGSAAGEKFAHEVMNRGTKLLAAGKEIALAPPMQVSKATTNFSPETSFDSLSKRLLNQPSSSQHTKTHAAHQQDSPKTETVSQREYDALKDMSDGEYDAIREYQHLNWKSTQPAHQPLPPRLSADSSTRVSLEEFKALQDKRYADYQSRKSTDPQTLHDKLFPGRVPYPSLSDYSDPKKMEVYRDKLKAKAAAEHPSKAQSTPLPDSDTPHQPYFDPLKNQENGGKTFLTDLDVRLSHDSTRALLEKNYQAKPATKSSSKQKAERVMDKMTLHLKDYFKSKPSQTDYEPLKADFLEKLFTENDITDKPTQESVSDYMDRTGKQLDAYQEVSDQYNAGRLEAYKLKVKDLNDIYHAQSEIMGAQQIFQAGYMLGSILNEPILMKSAQVGLAVGNAILCATKIAESNLKDIGTLALTGNWVGLFMSLASAIFPFFSQGPSIAEVTLDYLRQSVQHIVDHFNQVYQRFDQVGYMQKQMMGLLHTIIDSLQQMGKNQYDYHKSEQYSLNNIKVLVKDLSELVGNGFEVSHFEEFYNVLGQVDDVLEKKGTDYQSVQRLLNALIRNYITQMSENDYHTGQTLFDPNRFNYLTPQIETLTFSAHSPIDREFVTHDDARLKQTVRLEAVFEKMDGIRFLGFQAAYVKALLADELMDVETIDANIAHTHLEKNATSRAIRTLNNTLSHYVATEDATPEVKKAHEGDVKELATLKLSLTHATRRLVKLHSLKAQAILTADAQKTRKTLQTEQAQQIEENKQRTLNTINELQKKADALDAVMKPVLPLSKEQFTDNEEAKNWIHTHQELEFAQAQLVFIEQEQTDYALTCNLARTAGRPSFKLFNPLIWETAVKHYLDLLETQNSTSYSPLIHGRDLDIMIRMSDDFLYYLEYVQDKPEIAEGFWRAYADTILTIHTEYREDYQIYLANLAQTAEKKDSAELNNMGHRELKTVVDAGSTRVEEAGFVSEILSDSTALNVKYQGHFRFLDTQKKLLRMHCQLAGGSQELLTAIDSLFDQKNMTEQLKDLVTYSNKPVLFTTDDVYEHINQVYAVLEHEMIQPHRVLPPPSMTSVGAPIAATLQRLRNTKYERQMQHVHEQFAKSHYSLTFTHNVTQHTTQTRETPMPLENAKFIEVAQKAIDSVADMSDTENAVIYVGGSGAGKDVAIAVALGCELRYVKVDGQWCLEIVTCPQNVTWPEISHAPQSKTLTPKVYTEVGQDNPLRFLNLPGFFDNRGNATSLLAMLGTQVAIKKARKIKAVVITLRDTDLDSRCAGFDDVIEILSMIFKQSIEFYGEALKLHIGLSKDDEPSKEDIIERLKAYQQFIKARVAEEPTPLNKNKVCFR